MVLGKTINESSSLKKRLTGNQKAAIFLVTLGPEISSEIFKYLREDEIEQLTFEIARLDKVDANEKEMVFQEFQELMVARDFIISGGIDYAREVLEKSIGGSKASDILGKMSTNIQARPFDFIRKSDPQHVLNFIQGEHPQTIALILAFLDPNKSALVLGSLPDEIQTEVARRIAIMDRTSPEVIREVERVLERKLSTLANEDFSMAGGIDSVVEVLNLVDRSTERYIIEKLEEDDPDLAEEIKKRMFVFEDIILLDDRSIQKVLREVDQQDLAKSLKAVDQEVQDKIFNNMSKRAAVALREDMEFMGPIRLKDVEESQQRVVTIIRKLEEAGDIIISRPGEEQFVT